MMEFLIGFLLGYLFGSGKLVRIIDFFKKMFENSSVWELEENDTFVNRSLKSTCNPTIGTSFRQFLIDRYAVNFDDLTIKAYGVEKTFMNSADDIISGFEDGTLRDNFTGVTYKPEKIPNFDVEQIYSHFYQQQCKLMTGSYKDQFLTSATFVKVSANKGILYLYDAELNPSSRVAWLIAKD